MQRLDVQTDAFTMQPCCSLDSVLDQCF